MKSIQACRQCRRLKRKCNREKPFCSLCVRLGKTCEYPQFGQYSSATSVAASSDVANSTSASPAHSHDPRSSVDHTDYLGYVLPSAEQTSALLSFPSTFFIDPDHFAPLEPNARERLTPSSAVLPILSQVLSFLGTDLLSYCQSYNLTANRWLSIMSPKKLYQDIVAVQATPCAYNPTLTLLLSCIRILGDTTFSGVCQEYVAAKSLSSSLENEGVVSLRLVQSIILLAAYELGHSIHPSAYLTIGRAARLTMLLGFQDRHSAPQLFKPADTWAEKEEERRAWWAVFILDRFCNVYATGLPLAIHEPQQNFVLPISDMGWRNTELQQDAESQHNSAILALTTNPDNIGRFATTCQAAHLLGMVIKHRNSKPLANHGISDLPPDDTYHLDEALQLHRTLLALDSRITISYPQSPDEHNIEALALVVLSRYTLYNIYGCHEPDVRSSPDRLRAETEIQRESVKGIIEMATVRVPQMAQVFIEGEEASTMAGVSQIHRSTSLMLAQCFYHTATECGWFIREGFGPDMTGGLCITIAALTHLSRYWDIAERYLSLLAENTTVAKSMTTGLVSGHD